MKVIKFTPELTELIKSGKKTSTFRLFDDKDLQVGDEFTMVTRDGEVLTEFGTAVITQVDLRTLSTLTAEDYDGHEPVADPVNVYRDYYGDTVNLDTEVKIIRFQVIQLF